MPYQASAGVPLVIAGPGVEAGVVTDTLVEIQDLAATYLEIAGAEVLPDADAKSLYPVLCGEIETHRTVAVSALKDWRSVWDGRYKLIEHPPTRKPLRRTEGREDWLFDLKEDPGETMDLVGEMGSEVDRLRALLLKETG